MTSRLEELRRATASDATLRNLLAVIDTKLDTCARLPVFEYEALNDRHDSCAAAFSDLATDERAHVQRLLEVLQHHLAETGVPSHPDEASPSEPVSPAPASTRGTT